MKAFLLSRTNSSFVERKNVVSNWERFDSWRKCNLNQQRQSSLVKLSLDTLQRVYRRSIITWPCKWEKRLRRSLTWPVGNNLCIGLLTTVNGTVAIGNPSGKCVKLRTVAASNDHASQSLIVACSRHVYIYCCSSRTSRSWWITFNATPPERLQKNGHENPTQHRIVQLFFLW